jgi:ketosteroid isomerase-like protein
MPDTTTEEWVRKLFATIDSMQAEEVAAYFAEDGLFCFGNTEPARGRAAVRDANSSFFFKAIGGFSTD